MQKRSKFQIRSEASKKRWQRDEVKEAEWRILIDGWRSSGLSVRQYCMSNFITESSFRAWRREISLRDRESTRAQENSAVAPFVPVRLVPDAERSTPEKEALQIQLPGGASLAVTERSDLNLVARIFTALEAK